MTRMNLKKSILLGLIALGLVLAGCPTDSSDGGGTTKVDPTGISIKEATSLVVGGVETLTCSTVPATATPKATGITWESDTPAVATVDSTTGKVEAISAGSAKIIAKSTTPEFTSNECSVTVEGLASISKVDIATGVNLIYGKGETFNPAGIEITLTGTGGATNKVKLADITVSPAAGWNTTADGSERDVNFTYLTKPFKVEGVKVYNVVSKTGTTYKGYDTVVLALATANEGTSTVTVFNDESISSAITLDDNGDWNIELVGYGSDRTLTATHATQGLFVLGDTEKAILTLKDITLAGNTGATGSTDPLVKVNHADSAFTMNDSIIDGWKFAAAAESNGALYVLKGTATMNDGSEIKNCVVATSTNYLSASAAKVASTGKLIMTGDSKILTGNTTTNTTVTGDVVVVTTATGSGILTLGGTAAIKTLGLSALAALSTGIPVTINTGWVPAEKVTLNLMGDAALATSAGYFNSHQLFGGEGKAAAGSTSNVGVGIIHYSTSIGTKDASAAIIAETGIISNIPTT